MKFGLREISLILVSVFLAPAGVGLAVMIANPGSSDSQISECRRTAANYTTTDLGSYVWAYAINEHGEVVGSRYLTSNGLRAFIWKNGVFTDLGTGSPSAAIAANERGQAVGTRNASPFGSDSAQAFIWEDGVATDLGTLGGATSFAMDLNDRGQVIGVSRTTSGEEHAFEWQNGIMTDLTPQGIPSGVRGINNRGQIVGQYGTASGETHAFLWQRGILTDLGEGAAVDINERGQVLIRPIPAFGPDGFRLWQHGESIDLGIALPSEAVAMNDQGQILVNVWPGAVAIWNAGKITQVDSDSAEAFAINNRGQITGSRAQSGEFRGVLWSPSTRGFDPRRTPNHSASSPTLAVISRPGVRPLEFELRNSPSGIYVASVFDIGGRLIRRWERSVPSVGRDFWDGRRKDGVSVAPGIYFLRVETNGLRYDAKVLLTR